MKYKKQKNNRGWIFDCINLVIALIALISTIWLASRENVLTTSIAQKQDHISKISILSDYYQTIFQEAKSKELIFNKLISKLKNYTNNENQYDPPKRFHWLNDLYEEYKIYIPEKEQQFLEKKINKYDNLKDDTKYAELLKNNFKKQQTIILIKKEEILKNMSNLMRNLNL